MVLVVVQCQSNRSQHRNCATAMTMLKSRRYAAASMTQNGSCNHSEWLDVSDAITEATVKLDSVIRHNKNKMAMAKPAKENKDEPLEKQLWKAADKLRKNIDAAE